MTTAAAFLTGAAGGAVVAGAAAWRFIEARKARYGRLFSFAMHEINTPVTAVNMTVINLLAGVFGEIPPEQLKWIEMTRDQVGRLNALVGEVRDLVHMELHRKLRSDVGPAASGDLLKEALAAIRRGFEQAGVELRVETPEALPDVRTDAERAARSLAGMLVHARKFRVGGPVILRAVNQEESVVFEVEYTGQNLGRDEARRSLELFYPARKRRDQVLAATGLGLGLIREVMRRVGGDLDFVVEDKGRSRLLLRLPRSRGENA